MDSVEDTRRMSQDCSASAGTDTVNSDLIGIFDRYDVRVDSHDSSAQDEGEGQGEKETHPEPKIEGKETLVPANEEDNESGRHEKVHLVQEMGPGEFPEESLEAVESKESASVDISELNEKANSSAAIAVPTIKREKLTPASMTIQPYELSSFNEKSPVSRLNAGVQNIDPPESPINWDNEVLAEFETEYEGDNLEGAESLGAVNDDIKDHGNSLQYKRNQKLRTSDDVKDISDITVPSEHDQREEMEPLVSGLASASIVNNKDFAVTLAQPTESSLVESDNHSNGEQYQRSHHPFNFQSFLSNLKRKSANPIVRYIRSFLILFTRQGHTFTGAQKIKIVAEFKSFIHDKFNTYEPFASMNATDLENSREGLEKLVMNRIYEQCFPPEYQIKIGNDSELLPEMFKEDLDADAAFAVQLEKFSWVNGVHLDIDVKLLGTNTDENGGSNVKILDQAATELNKINVYRAPRDKIICILNCCKIIFGFLKSVEQETNADEFMPLLIFVIMKAKVSYFISNVHYIENFRGSEWLERGETSYYLSSIEGAIRFIQNMNKDTLTIEEKEYSAHMEAWDAEEKQRELIRREIEEKNLANQKKMQEQSENLLVDMTIPSLQPNQSNTLRVPQTNESLSPSRVLFTSAEMLTKSITSFLSPSPEPLTVEQTSGAATSGGGASSEAEENEQEFRQIRRTYRNLKEIFPDMDKGVLKDLAYMKEGDLESCVDACLELINDV